MSGARWEADENQLTKRRKALRNTNRYEYTNAAQIASYVRVQMI